MADIKKISIGGVQYSLVDEAARQITASGMLIRGTASKASDITGLTNYVSGWCYKASASFTIPGVGLVENGDMIIAINSNTTFLASDWTVLQNNVDTFTGSDGTHAGTRGLVPAPAAADNTKFLRGDGSWGSIAGNTDPINIIEEYVVISDEDNILVDTCVWGSQATIGENNNCIVSGDFVGDSLFHCLYFDGRY